MHPSPRLLGGKAADAMEKKYAITEIYNEKTGEWEKVKIVADPEVIDFLNRSRWKEEAQRKRDYYYQETKKEKEMDDMERYSFDRDRRPKHVSLEKLTELRGDSGMEASGDNIEDFIDLIDHKERLELLEKALEIMTADEEQIYRNYYQEKGSDRSFEKNYGGSRSSAGRHHKAFLNKLREFFRKAGYEIDR